MTQDDIQMMIRLFGISCSDENIVSESKPGARKTDTVVKGQLRVKDQGLTKEL